MGLVKRITANVLAGVDVSSVRFPTVCAEKADEGLPERKWYCT